MCFFFSLILLFQIEKNTFKQDGMTNISVLPNFTTAESSIFYFLQVDDYKHTILFILIKLDLLPTCFVVTHNKNTYLQTQGC